MLKKNVLRRKNDFSIIYKKGKSVGDRYVVIFYRPNHLSYSRKAFLASKKVGNSVVRHRVTRLIREAYRLNRANIDVGYDIVIVARPSSKDKKCQDIESALMHLCGLKKISHIG